MALPVIPQKSLPTLDRHNFSKHQKEPPIVPRTMDKPPGSRAGRSGTERTSSIAIQKADSLHPIPNPHSMIGINDVFIRRVEEIWFTYLNIH